MFPQPSPTRCELYSNGRPLDQLGKSAALVGPFRLKQALAREKATFLMLGSCNVPWMRILERRLGGGWERVEGAGSGAGAIELGWGGPMPLVLVLI
jgi:hypothetical protein